MNITSDDPVSCYRALLTQVLGSCWMLSKPPLQISQDAVSPSISRNSAFLLSKRCLHEWLFANAVEMSAMQSRWLCAEIVCNMYTTRTAFTRN